MTFVIALVIVCLAVTAGILFAFHAGQGDRIRDVRDVLTSGLSSAGRVLGNWYNGTIIPFFTRLRIAVMVVLGVGAVAALFLVGSQYTDSASARMPVGNALYHVPAQVSPLAAILIILVAAVFMVLLWWFGRPAPEQAGRVVLPAAVPQHGQSFILAGANRVTVAFAPVATPPVVKVTAFDDSDDFEIENVTEQSFDIVLPAPLTAAHTFNWNVAVRPQAVVVFPQAMGTEPYIEIESMDGEGDYEVMDVTNGQFTLALDDLPNVPRVFDWTARERPATNPIAIIGLLTFWSLLALGGAYLGCGVLFHSRWFVFMSIPFVAMALAIFFKVWHMFAWLAKLGVNALEIGPNWVFTLTSAAMTKKLDKIEELLARQSSSATQTFNLVNEEQFEKTRQDVFALTVAGLMFFYSIAILSPTTWGIGAATLYVAVSSSALWVMRYVANSSWLLRKNRARIIHRIAAIRERGMYAYYGILSLLSLTTVAVMFVPGAEEQVDSLLEAIVLLFNGSLFGASRAIIAGLAWLVAVVLSGAVVLFAWPSAAKTVTYEYADGTTFDECVEPRFPRLRKALAVPFGIILAGSLAGFLWTMVEGPVVEASANVMSNFIPVVSLANLPGTQPTDPPATIVSWPSVPGAMGYRLERRELQEPNYSALLENGSPEGVWTVVAAGSAPTYRKFAKGTTQYVDRAKVERGKKYFYRVIALQVGSGTFTSGVVPPAPSGMVASASADVVSKETSVVIPVEPPKPAASTKPPQPQPPASVASCGGPACGNPGLAAYCARHPEVCK